MHELVADVLVIGWGKGGKTLAGALGRQGRSVAMVEQFPQMYGGSCINIACVPTKAFVHSAESRRPGDDPQEFFSAAIIRRDSLIGTLRARNHAMLAEVDTVTLIDGKARFTGSREIEVTAGGDRLRVRAEAIIVNTGTVPARPPISGIDASLRVYDSTTIQHVDPLPERLLIVGGGYVGLEFAGMFARFGSQVTIVDRGSEFMPHEDRDVAHAVRAGLEDDGVTVVLGADVESISDTATGVTATLEASGGAWDVSADAVLLATGRRPATSDLGLDSAGIDVDERGFIVVDDKLRTSAPGVYAVGDINGGPQFTYVSLDDNRIVMDQLTGSGLRSTNDRVAVPTTIFVTPPLARVGLNETQGRASDGNVLMACKSIADIAAMPRPKILGRTRGLIKVMVNADNDLILGATMFSVDSQEVINLVALAMRAGVTASELRDGIWTHPSSTEAFNEVLAGLRPLS